MMIVGSFSAVAATTVGLGQVNGALKISGLDEGDKVSVYQVLKWGPDQTPAVDGIKDSSDKYVLIGTEKVPTGWVWGDGVSTANLTNADLLNIIGAGTATTQGITGALASKIANNLSTTKIADKEEVGATGEWSKTVTAAGLYVAIVEPKEAGTMYNPIFVAANYYTEADGIDSSNEIAISEGQVTYSDSAMAKKSKIPLEKEASGFGTTNGGDANGAYTTTDTIAGLVNDNNPYTGDVGEFYEFKVTTTVPKFADNYTNPVFKLKDTLSAGLKLDQNSIKVWLTNDDGTTWTAMDAAGNYDITDKSDSGWTITFKPTYLKGTTIPADGQKIKVTYYAEVTNAAERIVNQDTNDVDLIFSTTPEDTEGHGVMRRETNHFTFSIDAGLFGEGEWKDSSNEAIKIGVDKDGNPMVSTTSDYWGGTLHAPLEEAEFELWNEDGTEIYKNDLYKNGVKVKSDASGRITIKGLDVGKYTLKETKAPAGWIKLQDSVPVEITADITTKTEVKEEVENGSGTKVEVTYETNVLNGYTVKVGNQTTTYQFELKASDSLINKIIRTSDSVDKELANTKGVELPSTGGIGTTIFYVGGSLMVLAAAILLITKRRMGAED